jgi:hypothetical protein
MIFARAGGLSEVSPHLEGVSLLRVDAATLAADAVTLDALARLTLLARRSGYRIVLRRPSRELVELIELAGLSGALPVEDLAPGSPPPGG